MSEKLKPQEQGIFTLFGKRYMWLLNHKGVRELHCLDKPKDDKK